ncbi:amidohydrolase family protein [Stappia sp. F7233]|uniref:Amidohydrolase family protein n=1 Tax=Stappia albiluteola TaxID=2758565 RepID=A0A839AKQ6_9HYPH|nr:amidohydrolase family protein [Stappia albiluteola]MBA5779452.1 amidohydrolase family protein [Stappia albiluteola]
MIIDAHQHFWKVSRGDYFWMTDDVAPIRRDILPADLERFAPALGVTGSVLVQAAPTVAETDFLLDLAAKSPLVRGVVGWADLEASDLASTIDRLGRNPKLKGIRPMLQDIAETNWILRPPVLRGLELVQAAGLRFDALIQPRHLDVMLEVARRFPALPIVIDHCAKPVIRDGMDPGNRWRDGISALAEYEQIHCKLSGLATEHGPGWQTETLAPVSDHVLGAFGPQRVMWGSDWPVLELAGDYAGWLACARELTAALDEAARERVFWRTASSFYGLGDI